MPVTSLAREKQKDPDLDRFRLWLRVAFLTRLCCNIQRPFCKMVFVVVLIPLCAPGILQKTPNCDGRILGFWNDIFH